MPTSDRRPDLHYTPARIDYYLRNIEHLRAAAETPQSARQLLDPYRPGSTPATPRSARQRGRHSDPMRQADVIADLERAWGDLPQGLGRQIVYWRMWGYRLSGIYEGLRAKGKGMRKQDFYAANRAAVERMAEFLGWEPPPPTDEPVPDPC